MKPGLAGKAGHEAARTLQDQAGPGSGFMSDARARPAQRLQQPQPEPERPPAAARPGLQVPRGQAQRADGSLQGHTQRDEPVPDARGGARTAACPLLERQVLAMGRPEKRGPGRGMCSSAAHPRGRAAPDSGSGPAWEGLKGRSPTEKIHGWRLKEGSPSLPCGIWGASPGQV